MNSISKLGLLLWIAIRHPYEFLDRMEAIVTSRFEHRFGKPGNYQVQMLEHIIADLYKTFGQMVDWDGVNEIEEEVRKRMYELEKKAPFTTKHHGDFSLARVCYAACRLLQPDVVVETGVAYGVTTAFVLKALSLNNKGMLISIDLPPLGKDADAFVGFLVPEEFKNRWVLHRGTSKRILPKLLPEIGKVNLFIHDSLHTYWNIKRELNMVTSFLARPAIVVCDDIQGNRAFEEWVAAVKPDYSASFKESTKEALAGIAVFL